MANSKRKPMNLVGQVYGRLTILSEAEPKFYPVKGTTYQQRTPMWKCQCSCSAITIVGQNNLRRGITTSCGCLHKERISKMAKTHGASKTAIYKVWKGMRMRCNNPNDEAYPHYGGRGIKVCQRWDDFNNFVEDMGERPTDDHTIERIDNNGHYEPSNCKWATRLEQGSNKRSNRFLTKDGETLTITQWAKKLNISFATIRYRIQRDLPINQILSPARLPWGSSRDRGT